MKSIYKALNYNEQKVTQSKAELLTAVGFLKDSEQLSFYDKLHSFQKLNSLNEKVVTNTLHVSLNFDTSEQLNDQQLTDIAAAYMKGIGFAKQPYLVYHHSDAGHPHIHIVSSNIRADGSRISMHNLGRNESEQARKKIELDFGLVQAGNTAPSESKHIEPVNIQKVAYGKAATRQAIATVLKKILPSYNFVSLEQLNAVLKLYNVIADKGEEGSRILKHGGLQYLVVDSDGKKIGLPIKASNFHQKPTLAFLEKRFAENDAKRHGIKQRTKVVLDWILQKPVSDINAFIRSVEKENISVIIRQNKQGVIYGLTYIDHKTKSVFNGSELGKNYSAKAILELCKPLPLITSEPQPKQTLRADYLKKPVEQREPVPDLSSGKSVIDILLEPENTIEPTPLGLKKRRKKKRSHLS